MAFRSAGLYSRDFIDTVTGGGGESVERCSHCKRAGLAGEGVRVGGSVVVDVDCDGCGDDEDDEGAGERIDGEECDMGG